MTEGSSPTAVDDDSERHADALGEPDDESAAQHTSADVAPELFGW